MFGDDLTRVGNALVAHCKAGTTNQGLDELYADDAVSVEAGDLGGGNVVTSGLAGIKGKHEWWDNAQETHSSEADGPYFHGENRFGVIFSMDGTDRKTGERWNMKEMAVYTVEGGKIVREEFFYAPQE
ncbi:MAG: nuclear transport factor 2 family protein [Pseudomonadota bacterium]